LVAGVVEATTKPVGQLIHLREGGELARDQGSCYGDVSSGGQGPFRKHLTGHPFPRCVRDDTPIRQLGPQLIFGCQDPPLQHFPTETVTISFGGVCACTAGGGLLKGLLVVSRGLATYACLRYPC